MEFRMKRCVKRFLPRLAGTAIMLALLLPGNASASEMVKLSISHLGPATSPVMMNSIVPMVKELEATGKVKVTMYGTGSAYGNPRTFLSQVEKGIVDMSFAVPTYFKGRMPLNLLFQEPFLVNDPVVATRAYMKLLRNNKHIAGEWPTSVKVMASHILPPYQLHTTFPVEKLEDVAGKRIQVTQTQLKAAVAELGGSVAALPVTTAYENLSKGVVDGAIFPWMTTLAFRLIEVTKHHIEYNLSGIVSSLIINKKKYDSLPADIKAIIDRWSTTEAAVKLTNGFFIVAKKAVVVAKKKGHTVRIAEQAERKAIQKRFQHLADKQIKTLEDQGIPAREVYNAIVKAIAEEEGKM